MGIYNALFTGASGLQAFGESVRVIGDNIANVNSLGFKSQNMQFSSVLSQTIGVTKANIANQVGGGVKIGQITQDNRQGSVQNTTNPTDMAINGNGLFALKDPASGQTFYTRAGSFILDKNSNLIDGQGNVVQGWATDTAGLATGNVTNITFANSSAQAQATSQVTAGVTLDATAPVVTAPVFDPADPTTYSYKTQVNAYDSLGSVHAVNIYYTKTGNNNWSWQAGVNSKDLLNGSATGAGEPLLVGGFNASNPAVIPAGTAGTAVPGTAGYEITGSTTFDQAVTINGTSVPAGSTVKSVFGSSVVVDATGITPSATGAVNVVTGNVLAPANAYKTGGAALPIAADSLVGLNIAGGTTLSQAVTINGTAYAAGAAIGTAGTTIKVTSNLAIPAGTVVNNAAGLVSGGSGRALTFGSQGQLVTETGAPLSFAWKSAAPSNVAFNFGAATGTDSSGVTGTGLDGTVQMAGAFATSKMTTDGFASGFLDKLDTDSTGTIYGVFTNGQRRPMYQVALAKFANDSVLTKVGNNLQQETIASGAPILEKPGNGGMGTITPFGLEQSNVDLGTEFVKLIVSQRGYEANSKTIMTTDQMLSSLMQLKR